MRNKKIEKRNEDSNEYSNSKIGSRANISGMASRSRSKKELTSSSTTPSVNGYPKRRGRRPKKILDENDELDIVGTNNSQNSDKAVSATPFSKDPAVILRLRAKPPLDGLPKEPKADLSISAKSGSTKHRPAPDSNDEHKHRLSDNDSSEGIFNNDIPMDSICHKCEKYEKTIALLKSRLGKYEQREQKDKTTKIYNNNKSTFINSKNGKKFVIKKTNQKCLWDGCSFSNLPFPLPELYHNGNYYIIGLFCSPECALAHNLYVLKDSKIYRRKSLVYKLYRELHALGTDEVVNLKEAPPRELLEDYGGTMSIDSFRRNFRLLNKEYIVFVPPIKPLSIVIEEIDLNTYDDISDSKYVLKRKKPLSKKKSVIASMNMNFEEEDD